MRIISKFKDYYDHASVVYDTDKSRTYARHIHIFNTGQKPSVRGIDNKLGIIGFCGKLYKYTNLYGQIFDYDVHGGNTITPLTYDLDPSTVKHLKREFITFHDENNEPELKNIYGVDPSTIDIERINKFTSIHKFIEHEKNRLLWVNKRNRPFWDSFLSNRRENINKEYLTYFHKYNTPIFIIPNRCDIIVNIPLSELLFHRVIPPQQAYQQIDMYMGNEFFNIEKEVIQPDIDKVVSKGFDKKLSFRKSKEK